MEAIFIVEKCRRACHISVRKSNYNDFETMPFDFFWAKYMRVCRNIGNAAMRILPQFSAIYMCESGFFTFVIVKTKLGINLIVKPICNVHFLQLS